MVGYAPTNDSDPLAKDDFYNGLQDCLSGRNRKDMLILIGEFNAKLGKNNQGFEEVMGQQGEGDTMSDNGERFADACAANELVIGGTIFPHKRIHKITWVSPDNHTENQIDHICIGKKFRTSLQDVRSYRGADVGSDHHLVIGRVQLKLKRQRRCTGQRARYNVSLLKDKEYKEQFNITLKNRFQVLEQDLEVDGNIEGKWEDVKACWIQTCQEVLGKGNGIINHGSPLKPLDS